MGADAWHGSVMRAQSVDEVNRAYQSGQRLCRIKLDSQWSRLNMSARGSAGHDCAAEIDVGVGEGSVTGHGDDVEELMIAEHSKGKGSGRRERLTSVTRYHSR